MFPPSAVPPEHALPDSKASISQTMRRTPRGSAFRLARIVPRFGAHSVERPAPATSPQGQQTTR